MKQLSQKELRTFIERVRSEPTEKKINLPHIARMLGYDYAKQVEPKLKEDADFRSELNSVFQELKFELYENLLKGATQGKPRNRPSPEITYINAIIKYIDSGAITGVVKDEPGPEADVGKIDEHRKRLGL